jgi:hypothetical protein
MKRIFSIIAIITALGFGSCTKNDQKIWEGTVVEWDGSTWTANSAGLTYPIFTKIPLVGVATSSSSSSPNLTRSTGTFTVRVNLVGAQRATDATFSYRVVTAESTAVEGTHFAALSGTGTIPANSSFGTITINVLNPGATTGSRILVLELIDNGDIKANVNYAKIGFSIAQS